MREYGQVDLDKIIIREPGVMYGLVSAQDTRSFNYLSVDEDSRVLIDEVLGLTGIPLKVWAEDILEVTPKTLARYRDETRKLPSYILELVTLITGMYKAGIEVFGTQESLNKWLMSPAYGLNGHIPVKLLCTVSGVEYVHNELLNIAFGTTA